MSLTPWSTSFRVHWWWKKVSLVMRHWRQKFDWHCNRQCLIAPINHAKVQTNCSTQCFLTIGLQVRFHVEPHVRQLLKDVVKKEEAYLLLFDESLNSVCQSKQMDVHIRLLSHDKHQVESRYYTSVFMGHGTADDMLSHFHSAIEGIPPKKVHQGGCCSRHVSVIEV